MLLRSETSSGSDAVMRRTRLIITAVSVITCILSLMGGKPEYAVNDDTFRNLMSVGAFGDKFSYYIPYSNVFYGVPIHLLNVILPQINWYYWIMIGLDLVSAVMICDVLFGALSPVQAALFTFAVNVILARDFYIVVQFTKCASLWMIAGLVFLFATLGLEKKKWIAGVLLFWYGIACRYHCFVMLIPFIVSLMFFLYLEKKDAIKSLGRGLVIKRLVIMAVGVAVLFGAEFAFRAVYPEWKHAWDWDAGNATLIDHMVMDYDHDPEGYDLINTDANDINLYAQWMYADVDFFSVEWLNDVAAIEEKHNDTNIRINGEVVINTFIEIFNTFDGVPYGGKGIMLLALVSIILLFAGKGLWSKLYGVVNLGAVLLIYLYFVCIGRALWRAECGVFLAVFAFSGAFMSLTGKGAGKAYTDDAGNSGEASGTSKRAAYIYAAVLIAAFLAYSGTMLYQWAAVKDRHIYAYQGDIAGKLESFCEQEDSHFLLTDFFVANDPLCLTRAKWKGLYKNTTYMGGWMIPMPHGLYYSEQHGIDNPMLATVQRDKVYICTEKEGLVQMIAQHVGKITDSRIGMEAVSEGIWRLYKIQ